MTNALLDLAEELVLYTDSHLFLTGRAGTGKTTFLRSLQSKTYKRMVVVAPTGVAAINAGGQTIHSFFQLPFGPIVPEDAPVDKAGPKEKGLMASSYNKLRKNKLNLIRSLDLLVIDEISMVRADVLDAIDAVLRRVRHSQKPFGGVQVLMIGDVHQLAPVAKPDEWELLSPYYDTVYFFASHVLQKTPYLCVELDHIYRQHDQDFITLLNKVRDNKMDAECLTLLNQRYLPEFTPRDNEGYITLTTHNAQADEINESKLQALPDKTLHFKATVKGTFPENTYPTKADLELKIGAQVMFVKNDPSAEKAFFNGKIGQLVGYDKDANAVEVRCDDEVLTVGALTWQNNEYHINPESKDIEEKEVGSFTQIPLRLAWAVTIHKSQGLTFDKLIVDAGLAFAHGQVYVALSRCTSLEGLVLKTRIPAAALINDHSVDRFVSQIPELEPSRDKVNGLRHEYELSTLLELIDFYDLYKDLGKVSKVIYDNSSLFDDSLTRELSQRRNQFLEALCGIGSKFEAQVRRLHAQAFSCEENPLLQERLTKGAAYFKEQLDKLTEGFFDLPFKTDNKGVNEQLEELLGRFREDLRVKRACLNACLKGFSIKEYQRAKALAVLDMEKSTKSKVAVKDDSMKGNSLYRALRKWRADKAADENTELYMIVPTKVLKAIATEKPVTLPDLKKVKGIGVKRVKAFGPELIDIVLRSLGQKEIGEEGDFVDKEKYEAIKDYFESTEDPRLGPAKDVLGDDFSYEEIKAVLNQLKREGMFSESNS